MKKTLIAVSFVVLTVLALIFASTLSPSSLSVRGAITDNSGLSEEVLPDDSAVSQVALDGQFDADYLAATFELDADTAEALGAVSKDEQSTQLLGLLENDPVFEIDKTGDVPVVKMPYALKRIAVKGNFDTSALGSDVTSAYDELMDCTVISFDTMHNTYSAFE